MFAASKTASVSGGYQISRSLRFNSADSAYLNRTPASASNQKTWTWSGWVKRSALRANLSDPATLFNAGGNGFNARFSYANPDQLEFYNYSGAAFQLNLATTAVYRDVSAWYHIVFALDTTQATDTNRFKVYVNGTQVTAFSTATYPSQNSDMLVNGTTVHALGVLNGIGGYYSGYMTEINFIDGQALTPSSFGETNADTGVWQPKAYSGSYGTNGFYLNFSDNSNTTAATLGKDYSGNGNNWTPNNFSVTAGAGNDSLVDSPTSYGTDTGVGGTVRGNYATLNPLDSNTTTIANGNLDCSDAGSDKQIRATIGQPSGKWYFEVATLSVTNNSHLGIATTDSALITSYVGSTATTWGIFLSDGNKRNNGSYTGYGSGFSNGDICMIAIDLDNAKIWWGKNGTWFASGDPVAGTNAGFTNVVGNITASCTPRSNMSFNFGQRPFAYTAPSGFKALCTQNLPTPTIGATTATQAGKYFNPVLYTGTGATNSITGVGFQPDWVWIKARSVGYSHRLADSVRGAGKELFSNETVAETTNSANGYVSSFNSDGFSLTSGVGVNGSATTFVAWNWKANGSGSTNTAGTITSTVSASTTAGFSVVTYTGNGNVGSNGTVGHGLGVVPSMFIIKRRDSSGFWYVATKDGGTTTAPTYSLFTRGSSGLNDTGAAFTRNANYASSGYITSSILDLYWLSAAVTAGDSYDINFLTGTYVAYCFAEVAGYSKFGSYTGNGSADGPFVFTGFRPAYVLVKLSSATGEGWWVFDNKRNTYNLANSILSPNLSGAEITDNGVGIDIVSNGFKIRNVAGFDNGNGLTYIYAAFAESPFKYSLAR
jgi:hypothetical protein